MNLMDCDPDFELDAPSEEVLQQRDIALAARTSLPVLISAPPELALPMAIEIAAGVGTALAEGVFVVDAADSLDLDSTLARAEAPGHTEPRSLVVHDVHVLGRAEQARLMALMAQTTATGPGGWRVIATTSVPLYERVTQGLFDSRLFYSLNAIHIVAGGELRQDS
jgi:hypothetical protein